MENWLDLHMHSCYSGDGEYEPGRLMELCAEAGLKTVALADHISVQGIAAARTRIGVRTVRNPTRQGRERRVEHSRRGIAAQPRKSMTKEEEPADNRG